MTQYHQYIQYSYPIDPLLNEKIRNLAKKKWNYTIYWPLLLLYEPTKFIQIYHLYRLFQFQKKNRTECVDKNANEMLYFMQMFKIQNHRTLTRSSFIFFE